MWWIAECIGENMEAASRADVIDVWDPRRETCAKGTAIVCLMRVKEAKAMQFMRSSGKKGRLIEPVKKEAFPRFFFKFARM